MIKYTLTDVLKNSFWKSNAVKWSFGRGGLVSEGAKVLAPYHPPGSLRIHERK